MKKKKPIKLFHLYKKLKNIIILSATVAFSLLLLILFVGWFVEYRPQYIEFPFEPPSDSWAYVEYSTGYISEGHYWIMRYEDNCVTDCDEWVNYLDSNIGQLSGNWSLAEVGGPIELMCEGHLKESRNIDITRIISYKDNDSYYPYSLICVALESTSDGKHSFLSVVTVKPSFITEIKLSM